MGTLIDASVLIEAERGALDWERLLAEHGQEEIALSAVTSSELLHGVQRGTPGPVQTRRQAFVERLLEQLPVLPFDLVTARIHGRLWAQLAAQGTTVGERDLMIAATAIAGGHAVATRDARSFPKVPGLDVRRW